MRSQRFFHFILPKAHVALALALVGAATHAGADSPIEHEWITPQNAPRLGFLVEADTAGRAIFVRLIGPASINNGCEARQSGAFVFDASGAVVSAYMVELDSSELRPAATGIVYNPNDRMMMWIDYRCRADRALESRRYTIESIAQFLPVGEQ